jgi:hypothetical protein
MNMAEYQQIWDMMSPGAISETILRTADQAHIPPDPANRDRQEYETWLAGGNNPDPPDPLPEPPPPQPVTLPAHPEGPMDATTKEYVDSLIASLRARLDALEEK